MVADLVCLGGYIYVGLGTAGVAGCRVLVGATLAVALFGRTFCRMWEGLVGWLQPGWS
jgi:hypothetical protein